MDNRDQDERRRPQAPDEVAVRLTRKYAERIDGIDLVGREVGDRMPLPVREARTLIAEGWAAPCEERERGRHEPSGSDEARDG